MLDRIFVTVIDGHDMNIFLRAALRQPSTWRGLVWIVAGALGMTLSDSDTNVLASAAMIVAGALGAIPLDRGREDLNRDRLPPIERVGRSEGGARSDPVVRGELLDHSNLPTDLPSETSQPMANDRPDAGWNG